MGSNTSKSNTETAVVIKNNVSVCSNPDPRSPTPEITRTPLQDKTGNKHNITKNVDLRKTFENAQGNEKLIHNNPILSAVINSHLQSYDPRSPTQDFERTPIVIPSRIDDLPHDNTIRLQNESCASPVLANSNEDLNNCTERKKTNSKLILPLNLCNEFFDISLNDTLKDKEEPLDLSTASNETIEDLKANTNPQNINQPTRLLETNFDYTGDNNDKFEDSEENIHPGDSLEEIDDGIKCIPVFEILEQDPRSPSIGIERTPLVVPKMAIDTSDDNVEDLSDDILIKVLQNKNVELRQTVTNSQDKNEEGLLIYEDDCVTLNDTPKKCKSISNTRSRTPLSCMKNKADAGHTRSKSANLYKPQTEKVVPSKIPKRVSHIPRLKSLTKQSNLLSNGSTISIKTLAKNSSIGGDCENTPPQSRCDLWDKNNSIVL